MKLKAIHKKWDNKPCIIKPVFWPKITGLQFKVIEGGYSGSIFTCLESGFIFARKAKFQLIFIKVRYWVKMYLFVKIWYQYPHRFKKLLVKPNLFPDELPF